MTFQKGWTDQEIELAKSLWSEGYSAGQISDRLGGRRSRNAVLGLMHRMGLSNTRAKPSLHSVKKKRLPPKPKPKPIHVPRGNPITTPQEPQPLPAACVSDVARIRCLTDLEPYHCRWPVGTLGEDGFGFCGDRKIPGASYCRGHLLRSYTPIKTNDNKRQRATEDAARLRQNEKEKVEA